MEGVQGLFEAKQIQDDNDPDFESEPLGDYVTVAVISAGTPVRVMLAHDVHTDELVAIKCFDRSRISNVQRIRHEIEASRAAQHPHIIRFIQEFDTPKEICIAMEFGHGGDLYTQLARHGPITYEREACRLFSHMIRALEFCHLVLHICHRDVKPENLLFDNIRSRRLKLVDFGLSCPLRGDRVLTGACGTPVYSAPEVFAQRYDGVRADLWSAGVVLYTMLTGRLPFQGQGNDFDSLARAIRSGVFFMPPHLSPEVQDLIRRMLALNPADRPLHDDIRRHPWCVMHQVFSSSSSSASAVAAGEAAAKASAAHPKSTASAISLSLSPICSDALVHMDKANNPFAQDSSSISPPLSSLDSQSSFASSSSSSSFLTQSQQSLLPNRSTFGGSCSSVHSSASRSATSSLTSGGFLSGLFSFSGVPAHSASVVSSLAIVPPAPLYPPSSTTASASLWSNVLTSESATSANSNHPAAASSVVSMSAHPTSSSSQSVSNTSVTLQRSVSASDSASSLPLSSFHPNQSSHINSSVPLPAATAAPASTSSFWAPTSRSVSGGFNSMSTSAYNWYAAHSSSSSSIPSSVSSDRPVAVTFTSSGTQSSYMPPPQSSPTHFGNPSSTNRAFTSSMGSFGRPPSATLGQSQHSYYNSSLGNNFNSSQQNYFHRSQSNYNTGKDGSTVTRNTSLGAFARFGSQNAFAGNPAESGSGNLGMNRTPSNSFWSSRPPPLSSLPISTSTSFSQYPMPPRTPSQSGSAGFIGPVAAAAAASPYRVVRSNSASVSATAYPDVSTSDSSSAAAASSTPPLTSSATNATWSSNWLAARASSASSYSNSTITSSTTATAASVISSAPVIEPALSQSSSSANSIPPSNTNFPTGTSISAATAAALRRPRSQSLNLPVFTGPVIQCTDSSCSCSSACCCRPAVASSDQLPSESTKTAADRASSPVRVLDMTLSSSSSILASITASKAVTEISVSSNNLPLSNSAPPVCACCSASSVDEVHATSSSDSSTLSMSALSSSLPTIPERSSWYGMEFEDGDEQQGDDRLSSPPPHHAPGNRKDSHCGDSFASTVSRPSSVVLNAAVSVGTTTPLSITPSLTPSTSYSNMAAMLLNAPSPAAISPELGKSAIIHSDKPATITQTSVAPGASWYYGLEDEEEEGDD